MSRRNRSAEEQARRSKIRELLQKSNISSMEDIQNLDKVQYLSQKEKWCKK